jgi:hypothetical protein
MLMAPFNCMQVLLRSLPAPPVQRRLYFNTIVACRRRLAKRWEQTPVAKLFTLDDEWSMLLQRAQAVRVGDEAIGRSERHCARMHAYAHHGALTPPPHRCASERSLGDETDRAPPRVRARA